MGGEQNSFEMPHHYINSVDSLEHAFEMAEVYAMAVLRDVPFVDYETDEKVRDVIAELNKFALKSTAPTIGGQITAKSLLRGNQPGSTVGPHISQLFLNSFCARPPAHVCPAIRAPTRTSRHRRCDTCALNAAVCRSRPRTLLAGLGNLRIDQKFFLELDENNALTMAGWLDVQNGVIEKAVQSALPDQSNALTRNEKKPKPPVLTNTSYYMFSPRVIASEVSARRTRRSCWQGAGAQPTAFARAIDDPARATDDQVRALRCVPPLPASLAPQVHRDPLFSCFFNSALVALQNAIPTVGLNSDKTSAWATAGDIDLYGSLGHVALGAIRIAWNKKWKQTMRIRPEVMAQRIELARTNPELARGVNQIPGLRAISSNMEIADGLLDLVKKDNKKRTAPRDGGDGVESLFLGLQYPEGSPTHPSLPGGHSTVAGACSTVLKAMLQTFESNDPTKPIKWVLNGRVASQASRDGATVVAYTDADAAEMTVNGEINKLGAHIAFGRNWAGVHYRSDGEGGMVLGENYAISYLVDKANEYGSSTVGLFDGWLLEKFDGSVVRITAAGVEELLAAPL